jgi:hypothetical protein
MITLCILQIKMMTLFGCMNSKMFRNAFFATLFFGLPGIVLAQVPFTPLIGIPGLGPNLDFNSYINALYALAISIAALVAVIKIIIAGVKYMMSDVVSSKGAAKEDIQSALLGLLIIAAAYLILNQINPNLTTSKLLLSKVDPAPASGSTRPAGTAPLGGGNTGGGTQNPGGTTGSGATALPPANPATGARPGYYVLGELPATYLSENPAPAIPLTRCATNCSTEIRQCENSGGVVVSGPPVPGTFYCSRRVQENLICDSYNYTIPNPNGVPTTIAYRNCTPQLSRCYNRPPDMQRAAWTSGNVNCITNPDRGSPTGSSGTGGATGSW